MNIKKFFFTGLGVVLILTAYAQPFNKLSVGSLPDMAEATLTPADFNRDGFMDILVTGTTSTEIISAVYRNKADTSFFNLGLGLPALKNSAAHVADLDLDGWPDFMLAGRIDGTTDGYFRIFRNQGNETFQEVNAGIPQLKSASVKTGDFNNDGKPDILVMGLDGSENFTGIFINKGNLTFEAQDYSFPQLTDGKVAITDFNLDGYPDILFCGLNEQLNERTFIFINNGNGGFTQKSTDIPNIQPDVVETPDINSDGFPDIFISGRQASGNYITAVWKNNNFESFTLHHTFITLKNAGMAYADYNHDGFTDIIIGGQISDGDYFTGLNENTAGTGFNPSTFAVDSLDHAAFCWWDFNNNHKPDFISTGYTLTNSQTKLYAAGDLAANTAPSAPQNLNTIISGDSVIFSWDTSDDDVTPTQAQTFEIYMEDYQKNVLRTTLSDTTSGKRFISKYGTIFTDSKIIKNIPEGKYFWSVQAIDQAYEGSLFAPVDSFVICFPISAGNDTAVCYGEQVSFSVDDVEGTAGWYSAKNPATPFSTNKSVEIQVMESDTIWVDITKDFGTVVSDTVIITMNPLPIAELGDNKYICPGDILNLSAGTENDVVNWSTLSGNYSELDTNSFVYSFFNDDEIFVQLTDSDGCTGNDTVAVFMNDIPQIDLVNDTSICKFDTIHLTPDNTNDSINWYSFQQELLLAGSISIERYIDKTDTLIIEAYNNLQCTNYDTIIIRARELPVADAGEDQLVCEGYDIVIGPESPNENYNYLWSPNEHIDDIHLANPTVNPVVDSKYYVEVTDQFGCSDHDSVFVQINPQGVFDIGSDTSICPGGTVVLGGDPTAEGSILPYAYKWSPTESLSGFTTANPVAFPEETTTYTLIIYTGECPVDTLEAAVTVHPLPEISIMNDTLAGYQEDIQLWANGGVEYEWNPKEFLDNPYIQNPVANLDQTTNFTVQVTNTYGCSDTAGVKIMVKNELFIPDLFTPNNDGKNDYFKVYGFGIKELHLTVYNQQGIIVFESSRLDEILNTGWNGEMNGNPVKEGKYFWKMNGTFYNGQKVLFNGKNTGVVTILR